jgi:hypothetical protein
MLIKQLSVFLENRAGRLTDVTGALGDAGINISAQCIAESSDFGVLRMIVSDPERAHDLLRERGFSITLTNVICVQTPNTPGALHAVLEHLSSAGIGIEYMYAFALHERALIVLNTKDVARAIAVLEKNKVALVSASEIYRF